MEHLIKNLIEQLINKRELEFNYIENYKNDELNDLILISTGKIIELDMVIHKLNELLDYNILTKSK
jgi:L-serine deaminase